MFVSTKQVSWSTIGLGALIVSLVMVIALSFLDGVLRAATNFRFPIPVDYVMLVTWVSNFRYVFEQGIEAAIILFVGAKFLESRTTLAVGFDKLDSSRVSVKGPDEQNTVWIGQRYATAIEAQAIAETMVERLKQSASS